MIVTFDPMLTIVAASTQLMQLFQNPIGNAIKSPGKDQFDGDLRGTLTDPFEHIWLIATRKEDVSPDELQQRFKVILEQNQ